MISLEQAEKFVQERFEEEEVSDRMEDRGFAYYVNTQPREYLDTKDHAKMTIGNGPVVILKESGDVYLFPSGPMFRQPADGSPGLSDAKTQADFDAAIEDLKPNYIAKQIGKIE